MCNECILFEDDAIVVVNKPAGMIVHAAPGHREESLADSLAQSRPQMRNVGSAERPGVVHRLDIETSGVMVFAKTRGAYARLRSVFERHDKVQKTYLAVLHGAIKPAKGSITTLIGRKAWDPKRMAVVEAGGQEAITHWEVLQRQGSLAIVEFKIETGRTHQIRVHAAHLGNPIVGDKLYGDKIKDRRLRTRVERQLLHAVEITFPHPTSGKMVSFAAPPPEDIIYIS